MIEIIINSISVHQNNEAILKEALFLLSTLLFRPNTLPKVHAACDGTGLLIVTNAIYQNMRHDEIRKVAMELICQLSGEEMIQKVVGELCDIASAPVTADALIRIRSIAMTIGVLSMVPENLNKIAISGGITPVVILLNVMANYQTQANDSTHTEALTTLFASLEEIIAYGENSLVGIDVQSIVNSCVVALQKHSMIPKIVMSSLRLLSAITSFPQYRRLCLENEMLSAVNSIARQYASLSEILDPIVNIYLNISSSDDDLAIYLAKHNSTKMIMHCLRENLIDERSKIDPITSLLRILNRLSMLEEGVDILKRQGCVSSLFDIFETFKTSEEIQSLCLRMIQLLMNEKDIQEILTRLHDISSNSLIFSLTIQSIELIERACNDMRRLGLLMLCGTEVVKQIETAGGVELIQTYLINFSPTMNSNQPENSLVTRVRDEFANCCIEALGRTALRTPGGGTSADADTRAGADTSTRVSMTIAAVPFILQIATMNPTSEVLNTMQTLCESNVNVLNAIATGGGTEICLEICQSGNYEPDVMASAFSLLSALAMDTTGLHMIVQSNAADLICNHISESLMSSSQNSSSSTSGKGNGSGSSSSGSGGTNDPNDDIHSSLESAINVLQSLSVYNDNHINHAILKTLSEVIESLASWTRQDSANQYPELLASTLNVVISLLNSSTNSDEYTTVLLENGDIAKLDRLMFAHEDMYLKYSLPTHALADMMCLLITKNERTNQYIHELGSQEYLLRTMNYHPSDMSLQMKLAQAIGGLGMDAALSGLGSFIEQVDNLTTHDTFSSDIIPQISQYVQLIGNLMLIDGAMNAEVSCHLFNTLFNTCSSSCLLTPLESGIQGERDEALYTTINCFAKLLAMQSFDLSEADLQRILEFTLVALRDCETYQLQPDIKVVLLRILRNLLDSREKTLEMILKIDLFHTLQQLTPGTVLLALAANRRTTSADSSGYGYGSRAVSNVITAQMFTTEQNLTIDLILKKLFHNLNLLEMLPHRGVAEMCEVLCAQNTQNPGDYNIHWKSFIEKLFNSNSSPVVFGSLYLLDLLSELRSPSPLSSYASLRSVHVVNNLIKAIAEKITNAIITNEITSFNQQSHQDAIISTSLHLLPSTSLHLLDCLANTPAGAYAILQTTELIQYLINSMKAPATSLQASTIIVKIASHEIEGTMKLLIDNGLTKQILSSLKASSSSSGLDESYIQNAVYLLRVFADSIGISELRLPKETIKIMADLTLKFSNNEYLTSVAGSISSDLSEAFAIGPEAQLESQLNLFVNYVGNGNTWQQLMSEDNATPYFYNATTGASQWEEPQEYQTQLRVTEDFIELLTQKLNGDLSDVALSESVLDTIYSMVYNNSGDKKITDQLMQFVYAQVFLPPLSLPCVLSHLPLLVLALLILLSVSCLHLLSQTVKSNRTTLELLNENHCAYLTHFLQVSSLSSLPLSISLSLSHRAIR
jgi:hypothetical protein